MGLHKMNKLWNSLWTKLPGERIRLGDVEARVTAMNEHFQIEGNTLHIKGNDDPADDYEIWINTNDADYDGVCIGGGSTLAEAHAEAVKVLEGCLRVLRNDK